MLDVGRNGDSVGFIERNKRVGETGMFKLIVLAITTWGNTAPVQINPDYHGHYSTFKTMEECKEHARWYGKAAEDQQRGIEFKTFCVRVPD